jgi:predicted ATPase
MALAEKQRATVPRVVGHRLMGNSLLFTGAIVEGRAHYDQAIALYNPDEHRTLATRFGQTDMGVVSLGFRSLALWLLGYPEAALADTQHAIRLTRQIGQAATLMFALNLVSRIYIECGNYSAARRLADELIALAIEKDSLFWNAYGTMIHGVLLAMTGEVSNAVQTLTTGMTALRSTGATVFTPSYLSFLARAYADVGQFDEAKRCIDEAITLVDESKERWCEADIHRVAGEIARTSPERELPRAESYFSRAMAIARAQQAKSWELRAAMSMARLWRDQGKRDAARELLAPVYGWFTEGFDTLDLKETKALLDEV